MRISDWSSDVCSSDRFGRILFDLAKSGDELADRIVTTAPDVTQTTNLGAFVNQRGLFRRQELADVFHKATIPSAQKRSEERRVGKEFVSTCRSRWSQSP